MIINTYVPLVVLVIPPVGLYPSRTTSDMAKKTQMTIVKDQFVKIPPVATADLTGQTVVVVGANTGLGFEAAKHFSRMSPEKLILACRNEERGNAALSSKSSLLSSLFQTT